MKKTYYIRIPYYITFHVTIIIIQILTLVTLLKQWHHLGVR